MSILKKLLNAAKAFVLPLIVWLIFVLLTGGKFASGKLLFSILRTSVVPMIMAMALGLGMSMGMMNFALGAVAYACSIFAAQLAEATGLGIPGVCVFSILIGVVLCTVMGILYNLLRVPCLILSLGFAMVVEALPLIFSETGSGTIGLFDGYLGSPPWCFVILFIMALLYYFVNDHTTLGSNMKAIGADIAIANSAGINIDKTKLLSYMLTGVFTGVAGIVFLSVNMTVIGSVGFGTVGIIFDGLMGVFIAFVLARYINITSPF